MSLNQQDEQILEQLQIEIDREDAESAQASFDFEQAITRVNNSPLHQLLGYNNEHSNEYDESSGGA